MGEKLLARRVLALLYRDCGEANRVGRIALDWAMEQRDWLWPRRKWRRSNEQASDDRKPPRPDWARFGRLIEKIEADELADELASCLESVADLIGLDAFERELLRCAAMLERLPRIASLRRRLSQAAVDMPRLLGRVAGAGEGEAASRVRRSLLIRIGLLRLGSDGESNELLLDWQFSGVLDEGLVEEERLTAALAGNIQTPSLALADFEERAAELDFLKRMLEGALRTRAKGINILLYGPPGTGKTELARTLAPAAGGILRSVGEGCLFGGEPNRSQRLDGLIRAQHVLSRRGGTILLFDEMEDLFSASGQSAGPSGRAGSKVFVNRLLEETPVPLIWTSNDIEAVDSAHLRRMSYMLRMDYPSPKARARIAARVAAEEGAPDGADGLCRLLDREAEAASIVRVAIRAAALAGGTAVDAEAAGRSLILGLRGLRMLPPRTSGGALDLSLYEADQPIDELVERLAAPGAATDFSVLLTGPPGTGKTAFAAHLAHRLDRPLKVKRSSDLLSKWVGGTEANIAEAFAEARAEDAVLLFDEADSLLLDRSGASRSWEISQVNELLTWMDDHPLPFVAATNFAQRLDPAALRRFVFKIDLGPLSPSRARMAFERFFGTAAPGALDRVGGLTPGDFAVVKRQLRYRQDASSGEILSLLEGEARAKPERGARIGF